MIIIHNNEKNTSKVYLNKISKNDKKKYHQIDDFFDVYIMAQNAIQRIKKLPVSHESYTYTNLTKNKRKFNIFRSSSSLAVAHIWKNKHLQMYIYLVYIQIHIYGYDILLL